MSSYNDYTKLPIYKDIQKILSNPNTPSVLNYKAIIHTEKKDLTIYKILFMDTIRDYISKTADEIHLLCYLDSKSYFKDIYPYASNLEITITIEAYSISKYSEEQLLSSYKERFKAILKPMENSNPLSAGAANLSDRDLSVANFSNVRFQLVNRNIEPIRIKQTSGVFNNVEPKKFLTDVLNTESNKILVEGKSAIDSIDVSDASNTEVQSTIVVPSGTALIDVPDLLQRDYGGLYNSGLGSYIQQYKNKLTWFVYPLYDYTRFEKSKTNKVIFYTTDGSILQGSEVSYREEADTLYILLTGKGLYSNDNEVGYMDKGVGFRMSHAKAYMKKPMVIDKDGVRGDDSRLNFSVASKSRADGLNYAPRSSTNISSNPYLEYSKIASRSISQLSLTWSNSTYGKLYPGMPCKYNTVVNGETKSLFGIILHVHDTIALKGNPSTSTVYTCVTKITIAAERDKEFLKEDNV